MNESAGQEEVWDMVLAFKELTLVAWGRFLYAHHLLVIPVCASVV